MKPSLINISLGKCLAAVCCLFIGMTSMQAQNCDYVTGTIALVSTGGNITDEYTSKYVLTTLDGTIRAVADEPTFDILNEGMYTAIGVNYRGEDLPGGLVVGESINNIDPGCIDIGAPYTFTVCQEISKCDRCLGEVITLNTSGGNMDPAFTTVYVVTDTRGTIISILSEPIIEGLDEGLYAAVAVNYETAAGITGLEIGGNIGTLDGTCKDISEAYVFGVCQQLSPTIFFDLKGCDITQTATIIVAEPYDSYIWSTGATSDEITISATSPETYRVTVMLANGCIGVAEQVITGQEISRLGDYVWEDLNANGRQDASDPGLNGVTVNLYADFDRNGVPDFAAFPSCTTVTTDNPTTGEPGYYQFNVYEASYVIEFVAPSGYTGTRANVGDDAGDSDANPVTGLTSSINVPPNVTISNVDAGFRTSTGVGGSVWEDLDADGRRDADEPGLNGITINIYTTAGELISTVVTDSLPGSNFDGAYCFDDVPVQDYYVEIVLPDGAVVSPANASNNDALDSEGTDANGPNTTDTFSTAAGVKTEGQDFGIYFGGQVCGLVWRDAPMGVEGIYEVEVDTIVANSQVFLIDEETRDTALQTFTGADGRYCLSSVPVGSYRIGFGANSAASSFVAQNVGSDPLVDSDVNTTTSRTEVFFVGSRDTLLGINAGLRMGVVPVTLSSFSGYWDRRKDVNLIEWTTEVEINNDYFQVERLFGYDGSFTVIGEVDGQGNSIETVAYSFVDTDIADNGTYYYRLKQIDYDGGFEYSDIIAIEVRRFKSNDSDGQFQDFLKIFPNPAVDRVQVMLSSHMDTNIDIQLTDLTGRTVTTWTNVGLNKGQNLISLELENVTTGSYMLQFIDGGRIGHQLLQVAR